MLSSQTHVLFAGVLHCVEAAKVFGLYNSPPTYTLENIEVKPEIQLNLMEQSKWSKTNGIRRGWLGPRMSSPAGQNMLVITPTPGI